MTKSNKIMLNNVAVAIALLIVLSAVIFVRSSAKAWLYTNSSSTTAVSTTSGKLSGDASFYGKPSGPSSSGVIFGNPVSVSFPTLKNDKTPVVISTGSLSQTTPISPLDYGSDIIWYDGGYGVQSPSTGQPYADVVGLTKNIGVSVLRYPGGIPSDTFHWQDAIGAQSGRTDNIVYQSGRISFPSTFGPDEYGQFLQKTDSVGDITVNFGTGTAKEAADWVQYMTASAKNNYWGELRAKNGHAAPYDIPYWEVGNEQQEQSKEFYWRKGSVVSINDNGHCAGSTYLCEYVYGGTTKFSKQATINNSGTGSDNNFVYAQYPPMVNNSQTVYVNGTAWKQVANLADAYTGEQAYQINNTTGKITFGNGIFGAILPRGANVTVSYESGPHDGFKEYYAEMKAADPSAKICSSYDSSDFIKLMGSSMPYDCLAVHLYGEGIPSISDSKLFHNLLIQQSEDFSSVLSTQQAEINKYAGSRAKNISLAVTEYGVNALTSPSGQPNYHRSQDLALFNANLLSIVINDNIPIAEKHYLISYQNSSPSGTQTYINSTTFANNALIGGPGSNPVLQPSAYAIEAFSKLLYANRLNYMVVDNPKVVYSGGSYPALSVVATTDKNGGESIMVINLSPSKSVMAEVSPSVNTYQTVNAWTLGANNPLAYNTTSDPTAVGFVRNSETLLDGKVFANFPPGSITVMQLK